VDIVGVNPDMPGVGPSESWDDLKARLRVHRFYVHTADPTLEDGYNMAMFEAMAAGLPVLGNRHPTSPVEHGVTGFLSDDPAELRRYAEALLVDRELAGRMGARARESLRGRFSIDVFVGGFRRSIEAAEGKWKRAAQKHR
ncbi:MAG TPA: glycosyltransferase, partial [Polyangiaceae bacterium]|nr:glycosyltransferase [Polyangiaceae bacterium]